MPKSREKQARSWPRSRARRQDHGLDLGARRQDHGQDLGARRQDHGQDLGARKQDLEERSWVTMPRIWPPKSCHLDLGHDLGQDRAQNFFTGRGVGG